MSERFISIKEAAFRCSLGKTALYKRIAARTFPRPIPLGINKVVIRESELLAWMQAQVDAADANAEPARKRSKQAETARLRKLRGQA